MGVKLPYVSLNSHVYEVYVVIIVLKIIIQGFLFDSQFGESTKIECKLPYGSLNSHVGNLNSHVGNLNFHVENLKITYVSTMCILN